MVINEVEAFRGYWSMDGGVRRIARSFLLNMPKVVAARLDDCVWQGNDDYVTKCVTDRVHNTDVTPYP